MSHFDLLVIGSGPAGARAAEDAAEAGLSTALAESGFLGGTCLNTGCIPTKFLLGGTRLFPALAAQKKYATFSGEIFCDLPALQARKDRFVKGSRGGLEKRLAEKGVTLFRGKAVFSGAHSVSLGTADGEKNLSFARCILAAGSVPASFPGLKPDGRSVLSSAGLLNLKEAPESLLIVGAGAIGLELGEFFHRLGSKIILVEGLPQILPAEDSDVSEVLRRYLLRQGWRIYTGRRIASVTTVDGSARLVFESGEELTASLSLLAVGRRPNTAGLGAEAAGLALRANGSLETDETLRCAEHIYAVGDCNGRALLAHAADHQARYAAAHAAGLVRAAYAPPDVPACVYGSMEVMRVGPTQKELARNGETPELSRAMLAENAMAQSLGQTEGFVKMLWSAARLRSICAVGHGVSRLAGAAALLVEKAPRRKEPLPIIFAHPTLDEILESAMVNAAESGAQSHQAGGF
ncbi:MAG: NAD(P)/FAD-dependent oxidoreductase [Deltaproteobacteria bacterium]|jgi:dihydrolipoamide dehydrogenase|nr:NAD(P)/FAD-dependent oxidoreductase [Deltaproteobacteria bacterium]